MSDKEETKRTKEEIRGEIDFLRERIEQCKAQKIQLGGAIMKYKHDLAERYDEMAQHFPEEGG